MPLTDAHAHIGEYFDDVAGSLNSRELYMILNTTNVIDFSACSSIADRFPGTVFLVAGLHPGEDLTRIQYAVELIEQNAPRIQGIGEIGLDRSSRSPEALKAFHSQLELAERLTKPVTVHSRGMVPQVLDILSSYEPRGVLLHWFDSSKSDLLAAVSRGYYLSFGPASTYSKRLQKLAVDCPEDLLLVETDSPVRYGAHFEGKPSDPRLVCSVLFSLALARTAQVDELEKSVFGNFQRFLGFTIESTTKSFKREE